MLRVRLSIAENIFSRFHAMVQEWMRLGGGEFRLQTGDWGEKSGQKESEPPEFRRLAEK